MKIYCDGVFDLFHYGHINHFKKIKNMYPKCHLMVGILSDNISQGYKRIPFYNEKIRAEFIKSCKYVDSYLENPDLIMSEQFFKKYNIDFVAHGFSCSNDSLKQKDFFEYPIKNKKMIILDYTEGISTTKLINDIKSELIYNIKNIDYPIIKFLNKYLPNDFKTNILEIGGDYENLTKLFNEYEYFGINKQNYIVNHYIKKFKYKMIKCEYDDLPFKNYYFDLIIYHCNETSENEKKILHELTRLSRKIIIIMNIKITNIFLENNFDLIYSNNFFIYYRSN